MLFQQLFGNFALQEHPESVGPRTAHVVGRSTGIEFNSEACSQADEAREKTAK